MRMLHRVPTPSCHQRFILSAQHFSEKDVISGGERGKLRHHVRPCVWRAVAVSDELDILRSVTSRLEAAGIPSLVTGDQGDQPPPTQQRDHSAAGSLFAPDSPKNSYGRWRIEGGGDDRHTLVRVISYMLCSQKNRMADPLSKVPSNRLVYDGAVFRIEFYVAPGGVAPAEAWLEQLPLGAQQKFAALFARMGDTVGRRLILTHGFKKAGDKTPKREIDRAEAYKKDFEGRMKHER